MARSIPKIRDDSLQVPTLEGHGTNIITLGSAAWDSWVEHARSFRFESPHASFTARKERRPGGWYWYAYRRRHSRLHIAYLGKSEELNIERLHTVASVLERTEDSSEETSHQPHQRSSDALLQANHTTIIPFSLALSEAGSLTEARQAPKHNLPIQLTSLVGRESTIATATALLRRPEVRLLSMIGTGGIGKTRLAIGVATELLADFTDGVSFVALAPLRDPDMVLPTIAYTLGIKESGSEPVTERLYTYLRDTHLLLVLDNFEHLMPAAPLVGELLTTCPQLKLLVTSREVLHLRAEQQFSVPPLAVPDRKHVAQVQSLTKHPALDLFLQRARAVKHEFQLHESNTQALAEICNRLDGLPLAIELAAARIAMFSPQALLALLDHRLQILTHGPTDLPERQQTLRQTIQWSYELLNPEEQCLFQRMSVFAGGATLEAIEAVCETLGDETGWVFDGVTSLRDKSLLQQTEQEDEEPRLTMLETIREYGLEILSTNGEIEAARQAHAQYYLALTEEADGALEGPQQSEWLEKLEQEHDNLRTALSWGLSPGVDEESGKRKELGLGLARALRPFWIAHAHLHEGQTLLERARAASTEVPSELRAKVLVAAANMAVVRRDWQRGEVLAEEGLLLCREVGDQAGIAFALSELGICLTWKGEHARARSLLEESAALFREMGYKGDLGWSIQGLGELDTFQGKPVEARTHFEEALALFHELGDKLGIGTMLLQLARVHFTLLEDAVTARSLLDESQALWLELGTKQAVAWSLTLSAEIALSQGDLATARSQTEEVLALSRAQDLKVDMAASLSLLARVEARQGNYEAACSRYDEILTLAREIGDKAGIAVYLGQLAEVVAAQGEGTWAARLWGAAEVLREAIGAPLIPVFRPGYERAVAAVRTRLGGHEFAAAWAEGRAMTPEQALAAKGQVTIPALMPTEPFSASLTTSPASYPAGLTTREAEVLRLLAQGLTSAQIAEQLVISVVTVNFHVRSIYSKLGVHSRSEATRYTIEHHLM
jgi:predicted ATPase/DNA-binding CsgD family transcriptional regulator